VTRFEWRRGASLGAALLLVLPGAVSGQGWVVDASAGAAEYEAVAGEVGSVNAILGVRREGPTWLSLSAGVPLESEATPWAAGGGGVRWSRPAGPVEVGVDAAAIGFGYHVSALSATGGGATAIGLPFVALPVPRGRLELRSGVLHHSSFFDGDQSSRTVHDSGARALFLLDPTLVLNGEARLVRASEGNYPYGAASVEMTRGRFVGWLSAERWLGDDLDDAGWGIGARVTLPGRLSLRAAYDQEPQDPLYWNGSRRSWTVGISRAFGAAASYEVRMPPPEAFRTETGSVILRIPLDESSEPIAVAGDFTDWEPVVMEARDGAWEARFVLSPGIYHYSFRRADGSWFLPDSVANRVDDGFGGVNAVLVVVEP
jgi:hypothetical protein